MEKDLDTLNFQCVIADEAHYFKNWTSKRSQKLLPLMTRARRVILISGTPVLNRSSEAFNLVKTLRPDIMKSFLDYAYRYCDPKERPYGVDYSTGSTNPRELNFILTQSVMIRRLKKDVLSQLPPKRRQIIEVEPDEKVLKQVKRSLADFLDVLERNPR
jgi:SWI/SNF-related matrix-associated actin-dependent regulator 1 of chromatin subfamily A